MTGRPWRARAFLVALVTLGAFVYIGPPAHAAAGTPSWWSGTCDATYWNAQAAARHWPGARAHPLGASYLGVPVCGPRPAVDGAPDILWRKPGWGELEFECVELAMRFMGQVYGVSAYNANGNSVVRNYTAADGGNLVKIDNGTAGVAPQPGDIISFDSPGLGHVGVVAATDVDAHGNGTIRMLSQNDTADGWRTLAVANWRVAAFGNQVPYGWLHDPAGRGGAGSNSASASGYWMLGSTGTVYGFGGARNFGSSSIEPAAFASRRQGDGYWIVDTAGRVVAYGAATVHGGPRSCATASG